ncbi:hypothetical protein Salat_0495000 [Sesamum alatum]|uniref:Uncharacterized protein n=1 Tax=Sesamum alatum TaxID=300844 RepID=A0AAE1Z4W8_9LAMI|nr:hypothetical protein Salat_0495000 [Sesamum alatum]
MIQDQEYNQFDDTEDDKGDDDVDLDSEDSDFVANSARESDDPQVSCDDEDDNCLDDDGNLSGHAFHSALKNDRVTNNIVESFNHWVGELRPKPVLTLLDGLRAKLINRLQIRYERGRRWDNVVTPFVLKKLNTVKEESRQCKLWVASCNQFQANMDEGSNNPEVVVDVGSGSRGRMIGRSTRGRGRRGNKLVVVSTTRRMRRGINTSIAPSTRRGEGQTSNISETMTLGSQPGLASVFQALGTLKCNSMILGMIGDILACDSTQSILFLVTFANDW